MVGSDYVVVSDELVVNRTAAQFAWLLHLPDKAAVKSEGDTAWWSEKQLPIMVVNNSSDCAEGDLVSAKFTVQRDFA